MLRRYKQSIRVITAFYAVLLAFGLRNLLDNHVSGNDRWLLFTLASLFFLRFLLGSANQLWYEFVSKDRRSSLVGTS